jgi:hypothetical protein
MIAVAPGEQLIWRALETLADNIAPEASERESLPTTWTPQPGPQTDLVTTYRDTFEVFFGGARGGGKTDGMLGDWKEHEQTYGAAAKGVFFRRFHIDLEQVIDRGKQILIPLGYKWNAASHTFHAPSGASLKIRHCKDTTVAARYQGHAYTRVYVEECGQWPDPDAINLLRATLRSAEGVPCGIRLTGNPGGVGHGWVKARYVDPAPAGRKVMRDQESGKEYVFLPSRLEDNKILTDNDPEYESVIMGVGNKDLAKAWRWGIWDIVAGGFFSDIWDGSASVLSPFEIPPTWSFFYSFDWGSAKPSSLGMYAASDGTPIYAGWCRGRVFPRGSILRFAEDYTVSYDRHKQIESNVGLRLSNAEAGARIAMKLSQQQKYWAYGVADPSIFTEQGGPSIYDQMRAGARTLPADIPRFAFEPADNSRITGWQRLIGLMRAAGHRERPGFYVFNTCTHWLRTVPTLVRDERNLDDIDTEAEDHGADETRYACMSRSTGARIRAVRASL